MVLSALEQDDGENIKAFVQTYRRALLRQRSVQRKKKDRATTTEKPHVGEQVSPVRSYFIAPVVGDGVKC